MLKITHPIWGLIAIEVAAKKPDYEIWVKPAPKNTSGALSAIIKTGVSPPC